MSNQNQLVTFLLDDQRYALNLSCVERIVRAVEVTHVPEAPDVVLGVINVEGRITPVVNSRRRLGLREREVGLDDLFIIVRENGRGVALVADQVLPVHEIPNHEVIGADAVLPGSGFIQGVAKDEHGMIMILTPGKTLSSEERQKIESSMEVAEDS